MQTATSKVGNSDQVSSLCQLKFIRGTVTGCLSHPDTPGPVYPILFHYIFLPSLSLTPFLPYFLPASLSQSHFTYLPLSSFTLYVSHSLSLHPLPLSLPVSLSLIPFLPTLTFYLLILLSLFCPLSMLSLRCQLSELSQFSQASSTSSTSSTY
jgi:hypothetical protein